MFYSNNIVWKNVTKSTRFVGALLEADKTT